MVAIQKQIVKYSLKQAYVIVLPLLPLLKIVFLGLEFDDAFPEFSGFLSELVYGKVLNVQGLDADGQRDLLFFLELLLGLVAFQLSVAKAELLTGKFWLFY